MAGNCYSSMLSMNKTALWNKNSSENIQDRGKGKTGETGNNRKCWEEFQINRNSCLSRKSCIPDARKSYNNFFLGRKCLKYRKIQKFYRNKERYRQNLKYRKIQKNTEIQTPLSCLSFWSGRTLSESVVTLSEAVGLYQNRSDYVWIGRTMFESVGLCLNRADSVWIRDSVWIGRTLSELVGLCLNRSDSVGLCLNRLDSVGLCLNRLDSVGLVRIRAF